MSTPAEIAFAPLYHQVATWAAIRYGMDEVLKITEETFSDYLDLYHMAMYKSLFVPELLETLSRRVYDGIRSKP